MKKHEIIITLSILTMHYNFATTQGVEGNDPIDLRIRVLKNKVLEEVYPNRHEAEAYDNMEAYDTLDAYVDKSKEPITPISEHDQRKLDDRYKQPELKSTTTEKFVASLENSTERPILHQHTHKKKKSQRMGRIPKAEIFYRRMAFDISKDRNKPQKWTHCLDLLSPFLNGYLDNISNIHRKIYSTDSSIRRLAFLLTLNMTDATTEEIRSTLYEISNVPIRIYQWDISAVKAIFAAVIRDGPHNFKGLKYGIKGLFNTWKLNTSNLTRLLTQSRVFRPPCIQINHHTGSTVSQKPIRFTKPNENGDNGDNDDKNPYATKADDC